ncbi:limonene-1,2-epoxide hydrolase [Deinobacterium chartae]|uniref:Limonene-1,2-epoxide hydrolase n=1 Tax=Deinobacterium chartae TaxID=521158 RepID=A0A841I2H3_9DEIO|nr:nuclear transport factor 2 family protein [Deinobacterium chartae]MBB6099204.1 limonene-1,2-epoxide hydrolase [Deinobacterium chartae]
MTHQPHPSELAENFMRTLQEIERQRDPQPMLAFFDEQSTLRNLGLQEPMHGLEGAQRFWQAYLDNFSEVRTDFNRVIEGPQGIALEWESSGKLGDGRDFRYEGITVLEVDEDKVRHFRSYYDSAAFLPEGAGRVAG